MIRQVFGVGFEGSSIEFKSRGRTNQNPPHDGGCGHGRCGVGKAFTPEIDRDCAEAKRDKRNQGEETGTKALHSTAIVPREIIERTHIFYWCDLTQRRAGFYCGKRPKSIPFYP